MSFLSVFFVFVFCLFPVFILFGPDRPTFSGWSISSWERRKRELQGRRGEADYLYEVAELSSRVALRPGEAEYEAVVPAVVPPVEAALTPVATEGVQPVPQYGQPCPPVSQDYLHPPSLSGSTAAQVEEEDGNDVVPGDGVQLHGGGGRGVERGQAAAYIADTLQTGEGRFDDRDFRWREETGLAGELVLPRMITMTSEPLIRD